MPTSVPAAQVGAVVAMKALADQQRDAEIDAVLVTMGAMADDLCRCTNEACADGVMKTMASMRDPDGKPTEAQIGRAMAMAGRRRRVSEAADGASPGPVVDWSSQRAPAGCGARRRSGPGRPGIRPIIGGRMSNPTSRRLRPGPRLWLLAALAATSAAAAGCTDPGGGADVDASVPEVPPSTPMRHLNRVELADALRDLLGTAFTGDSTEVAHRLPQDAPVGGLDTIAQALGTSPLRGAAGRRVRVRRRPGRSRPGSRPGPPEQATALPALLDGFGRRALRRPLTAEERTSYTALYEHLAPTQGHAVGVRAVLQRLLWRRTSSTSNGLGNPATGKPTSPTTRWRRA